ncbi:histone acetyltransferase KAT5-like, partial [Oxyura jamaicensis]|uniref:histone acetyltransferase KAT5-like n=1 Tax=Oxyura jamaicensis TaxID=8884 RepID=UPI0015A5B5E2
MAEAAEVSEGCRLPVLRRNQDNEDEWRERGGACGEGAGLVGRGRGLGRGGTRGEGLGGRGLEREWAWFGEWAGLGERGNPVSPHLPVNKRLDEWVTPERLDLQRVQGPRKEAKTPTKNGLPGSRPDSPERDPRKSLELPAAPASGKSLPGPPGPPGLGSGPVPLTLRFHLPQENVAEPPPAPPPGTQRPTV